MSLLNIYPPDEGAITYKSSRIPETGRIADQSSESERRGAIVRKDNNDRAEKMMRLFRARVKFWQVLVLMGLVILVYRLTGHSGYDVYTNRHGVILPRLNVLPAMGMQPDDNEHAIQAGEQFIKPDNIPDQQRNNENPNEVGAGETLRSVACVPLKSVNGKAKICLFNPNEDYFISRSLLVNGTWDKDTLNDFKMALNLDPELGLIDIGANLGTYSLTAGAEGRRVVAVEAYHQTVIRLKKSVEINHFRDRISIVEAAVMSERGYVYMHAPRGDPGAAYPRHIPENNITDSDTNRHLISQAILLDDVAKYVTFQKAILKIDIDGEEYNILQRANRLFDVCDIKYIFVVFSPHKGDSVARRNGVEFLQSRGYVAKRLVTDTETFLPLHHSEFPSHLVWVKRQ